jgi:restriction system protein
MKIIYLLILIILLAYAPIWLIFYFPILIFILNKAQGESKVEQTIEENKRLIEMTELKVKKIAIEYEMVLARKRQQWHGMTDDYGDIDNSKWKKEVNSFIRMKVVDAVPDVMERLGENHLYALVDDIASQVKSKQHTDLEFSETMDGIDYEHYCADILRNCGWEAIVSKASNDFGADIIAKMNGITVAIQCKRYSKPIGISAVQEVVTGQQYYDADHAAVVTNNSFTPSARTTAIKTNVILIHHEELQNLAEKFGMVPTLKLSVTNTIAPNDVEDLKSRSNILIEKADKRRFKFESSTWKWLYCSYLRRLRTPSGLTKLSSWDILIRIIFGILSLGGSEIILFIWRRISNSQTCAKHAVVAFILSTILQGLIISNQPLDSAPIGEENSPLLNKGVADEISALLAELKKIPTEKYEDNLQRYKILTELAPLNTRYKEKVDFYEFMSEASKRVSHLKDPVMKKAFELNVELRNVHSSNVEKNIYLYQKLDQLDPDNPYYRSKLAYYNLMKQ